MIVISLTPHGLPTRHHPVNDSLDLCKPEATPGFALNPFS